MRLTYNYAYSDTNHFYFHERRQYDIERATDATSLLNEHLFLLEVDITEMFQAVAEVPFIYARQTRSGPGSTAVNGAMVGAGLADIRIGSRAWVFQDEEAPIRLYLYPGLRLPTGAANESFISEAGIRVTKDVSVQPGTGNLAFFGEIGGTLTISEENAIGMFFSARYTFAPSTNTSARNFRNELSGNGPEFNSDSDSAFWKVGMTFGFGQAIRKSYSEEPEELLDGLAFLFAVSGAHVPYSDIFGATEGFRRAANLFFVEPGLVWAISDRVTFNASVPLTVYRYIMDNGGNVPDWVVQGGLTFTFN